MGELQVAEISNERHWEINMISGVNYSGTPSEIPDDKAIILRNYMPVIGNKLRKILPFTDVTLSIVLPANIVRIFQGYLGTAPTATLILFLSDGSAYKHVIGTGITSNVWVASTFTDARAAQWKQESVLVIDPVNGYFEYDGTTIQTIDAGFPGSFITVFNNRAIIAKVNTNTVSISAPNDFTDFATANGGLIVIINEEQLKGNITGLISTTDIVYIFGETSTIAMSNIYIDNTVTNTVAEVRPLLAHIGCKYSDSLIAYENIVYTWDVNGVWEIAGFEVNRISEDIDGILEDVQFNSFSPVSFIGNMFNINFYATIVEASGAGLSAPERRMFCYYNKGWFEINYNNDLWLFGANSFEVSGVIYNFASIGATLKNLFDPTDTSTSILTKLETKRFPFGDELIDNQMNRIRVELNNISADVNFMGLVIGKTDVAFNLSMPVSQDLVWKNNTGGTLVWKNDTAGTLNWVVGRDRVGASRSIGGRGKTMSIQLEENSAVNYELSKILLGFWNRSAW